MQPESDVRAFIDATEKLCGEANEAAKLATTLFSEPELGVVCRALARCMELVHSDVHRAVRSKYPGTLPDAS
jgi:hypothetical protein